MKPYLEAAIRNVYRHGDTDIFPFPIENRIIHDSQDKICDFLIEAYNDFDSKFAIDPPEDIRSQVPVHHTGFRWATQLDPLWNILFLGAVLSISEAIERKRLTDSIVYSYRLSLTNYLNGDLFRNDLGWYDFISESRKLAESVEFVVVCDIADCYSRISHHKLENSIRALGADPKTKNIIMKYLGYLTGTKSSGLPIGGPASRILAELALVNTDQLLNDSGILFVRYADDYHFFCSSRREAYDILVKVTEALDNEGLSLQKSKTRILRKAEFISSSKNLVSDGEDISSPVQKLMSLSLRYDPYAANAVENYEELKKSLSTIDIVALLNEQLSKSRVHIPATKKIINAVRHINADQQYGASISMLNSMDLLYPIASTVFITISSTLKNLSESQIDSICSVIRGLYDRGHEVMSTPVGLAYAIRILGSRQSPANQVFLNRCFEEQNDSLVRRDIIIIFANWGNFAWLSLFKSKFNQVSSWERRSLVLASFSMLDEGSHWRSHVKGRFTFFETVVRDWRASRAQQSPVLPL